MGFLQAARDDLTAILTAVYPGLHVEDHNPARLNLPAVIILYGNPVVESGEVYGTVNVRFTVTFVPQTAANDKATDELTKLIETSVVALAQGDYGTESVGQPYMLAANNGTYIAADATLVTAVPIT